MTVNAMVWCTDIMQQYNFREEVQRLLLKYCDFTIDDPWSTHGGGWCRFGYGENRTHVHLFTGQHEAAVHEMAHAWWFLLEKNPYKPKRKDRLVGRLIAYFLRHSDLPPRPFPIVRGLCRVYRYGEGNWPGMWMPEQGRWNHDEVLAGLASGTMGNLDMYPYDLRRIYSLMFAEPQKVYVPAVMR